MDHDTLQTCPGCLREDTIGELTGYEDIDDPATMLVCDYCGRRWQLWHACGWMYTRQRLVGRMAGGLPWYWLDLIACTPRHVDKYTGAPVRRGAVCCWLAGCPTMPHMCVTPVTRNSDVFDVVLHRGVCVERARHWHAGCNS